MSIDKRIENWLVSEDGLVVRCPQHITDWQMRMAGRKRTKDSYRWRRIAKETDQPIKEAKCKHLFRMTISINRLNV